MSLRNRLAMTTMLGLGSLLCKAQTPSAHMQALPDSVLIEKTGYVVKPYAEQTVAVPGNAVLHGSFSSHPKYVWMDRDNYRHYVTKPDMRTLVEKMTAALPDTSVLTTGFFTAYDMKNSETQSVTNKVICTSGWEARSPENRAKMTANIQQNKHDIDAYQQSASELEYLDLVGKQFFLADRPRVAVEQGRAPQRRQP